MEKSGIYNMMARKSNTRHAPGRVLFFILCLGITILTAGKINAATLSAWSGIASLNLDEINKNLGTVANISGMIQLNAAQVYGFDFGVIRLQAFPEITSLVIWAPVPNTQNSTLITTNFAMAAVGFRTPHPSTAVLNFGLYAGYGYLTLNERRVYNIGSIDQLNPERVVNILSSGSQSVGEAVIGLKIAIFELAVSYRYAVITDIRATADALNYDGKGNDILAGSQRLNSSLQPLVYDFSGSMVSLGFRF